MLMRDADILPFAMREARCLFEIWPISWAMTDSSSFSEFIVEIRPNKNQA
jgi:hypothetical protein